MPTSATLKEHQILRTVRHPLVAVIRDLLLGAWLSKTRETIASVPRVWSGGGGRRSASIA